MMSLQTYLWRTASSSLPAIQHLPVTFGKLWFSLGWPYGEQTSWRRITYDLYQYFSLAYQMAYIPICTSKKKFDSILRPKFSPLLFTDTFFLTVLVRGSNRGFSLFINSIPYLSSHTLICALYRALNCATDLIHQILPSPNPVFGNPIFGNNHNWNNSCKH